MTTWSYGTKNITVFTPYHKNSTADDYILDYLLQELGAGSFLLQEDGSKIITDGSTISYTNWTFETKN